MTGLQRAQKTLEYLRGYGLALNDHWQSQIITIFAEQIEHAKDEARTEERRRVTADWLAEVVPGEVLQMAADKVAGREL